MSVCKKCGYILKEGQTVCDKCQESGKAYEVYTKVLDNGTGESDGLKEKLWLNEKECEEIQGSLGHYEEPWNGIRKILNKIIDNKLKQARQDALEEIEKIISKEYITNPISKEGEGYNKCIDATKITIALLKAR